MKMEKYDESYFKIWRHKTDIREGMERLSRVHKMIRELDEQSEQKHASEGSHISDTDPRYVALIESLILESENVTKSMKLAMGALGKEAGSRAILGELAIASII